MLKTREIIVENFVIAVVSLIGASIFNIFTHANAAEELILWFCLIIVIKQEK